MKDIFQLKITDRPLRNQNDNNLEIPKVKTEKYGTKSLKALGPKIWNKLPNHIKTSNNLPLFKKMLQDWDGEKCHCQVCRELSI